MLSFKYPLNTSLQIMMSTSESFISKIKLLTAINYTTWKDDIEYVLREKKPWRIVSGLEPSPATATTKYAATAHKTPESPATPSPELLKWMEKAEQATGILGQVIG